MVGDNRVRVGSLTLGVMMLMAGIGMDWSGTAESESGQAPQVQPMGDEGVTVHYQSGFGFGPPSRLPFDHPFAVGGPGEPTMEVGAGGEIYITGMCCEGAASPVWASFDDGASFETLPSPLGVREKGIGTEGDLVATPDGRVFFVELLLGGFLVTEWNDDGRTWTRSVPAITEFVPNDRPWLEWHEDTLFLYVNHGYATGIHRSIDDGLTWEQIFFNGPGGDQQGFPRLFPGGFTIDPSSGAVHLAGACNGGFEDTSLCAASSSDDGDTWTWTKIQDAPRGRLAPLLPVSLDTDEAGTVYVLFADQDDQGCGLHLAVSLDGGAGFRSFPVEPVTGCAAFPWMSAGASGRIALSWYQNAYGAKQDAVPENAPWTVFAAVIEGADTLEPVVTYGSLEHTIHYGPLKRFLRDFHQSMAGPDGRLHIAFNDDASEGCAGLVIEPLLLNDKCIWYVGQTTGPRVR